MQTRSAKIDRKTFHKINRDIKTAMAGKTYNAETIGLKHGVSPESVRAIRRAKTWPQWERDKAEKNRRRMKGPKSQIAVPVREIKSPFAEDEDTVTITRSRFHHFLELERRADGLPQATKAKPWAKLRPWRRR